MGRLDTPECGAVRDAALWLLCGAAGLAVLLLGLLGTELRPQIRAYWVLLAAILLAALAAALGRRLAGGAWPRRPRFQLGGSALLLAAAALAGVLFARLGARESFGGRELDLDFGVKCDKARQPCSHNLAFDVEFNSFGHSAQGLLIWFMFPAVEMFWLWLSPTLALVARWGSLGFIVYPTYNIVKRTLLHGTFFAVSSFCNNGMEWGMGFLLGLALGLLCSAAAPAAPPPRSLASCDRALGEMQRSAGWRRAEMGRLVAGCILGLVAVCASVGYTASWSARPEGSGAEEPSVGAGTLAVMALAPLDGALLCCATSLWLGLFTGTPEQLSVAQPPAPEGEGGELEAGEPRALAAE